MAVTPRALMHLGRGLSSWIVVLLVGVAGAWLGSHAQASLQRFDAAEGDRFAYPYDHHLQLLITADGDLHAVAPSELAEFSQRHPRHELVADAGERTVSLSTPRDYARLDYRVLDTRLGQPLIETRYEDGEWSILSRYRVDGNNVVPLYVRAWNVWLMATGLLYYGLPLALVVWLTGRFLRRHEERVLLDRGERPYLQHRYHLT